MIRSWESWAFDQFIDNFSNSSAKSTTLDELKSYVFIPKDNIHLLFGDPNSWGVIATDLGYIRMIYSVGVIGSLIFYGGFIQILIYLTRYAKSLSMQVFLLFLFLWLFIIEYKEPMFLNNYNISFITLMIFFTMSSINKKNINCY